MTQNSHLGPNTLFLKSDLTVSLVDDDASVTKQGEDGKPGTPGRDGKSGKDVCAIPCIN